MPRRQNRGPSSDLLRAAQPAHRRGDGAVASAGKLFGESRHPGCLHRSGAQRADANLAGPQFNRPRPCEASDRGLRLRLTRSYPVVRLCQRLSAIVVYRSSSAPRSETLPTTLAEDARSALLGPRRAHRPQRPVHPGLTEPRHQPGDSFVGASFTVCGVDEFGRVPRAFDAEGPKFHGVDSCWPWMGDGEVSMTRSRSLPARRPVSRMRWAS